MEYLLYIDENMFSEKCVILADRIVIKSREEYPRARNAIYIENLMSFVWMKDPKILSPSKMKKTSEKQYEKLYNFLKAVRIEKYIARISIKKK